jgi:predicted ATP-grasp superfamily ATP-dependent carboligase
MNKILLTNAQLRKTLAAVRSLGKQGVPAYVAETTLFSPAAYSRYCKSSLLSPDPDQDQHQYAEWLADTMRDHQIRLLLPMDDNTMQAVMDHADLFEEATLMMLPPPSSYTIAADKGMAAELAAEAGVPVPRTYCPTSLDEVEGMGLALSTLNSLSSLSTLSSPLVIKPRRSSGSRGIRVIEHPQVLQNYAEVHARYPFPILQEFIPAGERYDVCLLYDAAGELKASFVQKELRHFPLVRGPSTMQESVHRPDLIDLALSIMAHLPWRGIVELEFMIDPRDGLPKFMEINPRFWNSLHASILAGVDFPWLWYRLACGEAVEKVFDYKAGVRCRSLLPGDILHYMANPKRLSMNPSFWSGHATGGSDDIVSWRDPLPALGFVFACLRYVLDPKAWRMLFHRS